MKDLIIAGGETHIGEVSNFIGSIFNLKGVCVKDYYYKTHFKNFGVQNYKQFEDLLISVKPEVVAVSNENNLKKDIIIKAFTSGAHVIADKPIAITLNEQAELEKMVENNPDNELIMLLTLRGEPVFRKMKEIVMNRKIGDTAFCHVRMSVQMKRDQRPPWFLDYRKSGGMFLDLLIHGLDAIEWVTGCKVTQMTAITGNFGHNDDEYIKDHASVYLKLDNGASAIVEGQRLMPQAEANDYRMLVAGTKGYVELDLMKKLIILSDDLGSKVPQECGEKVSIVKDWYNGGRLITTADSIRANKLAVMATIAAEEDCTVYL